MSANDTKLPNDAGWESIAAEKRQSDLNKIPLDWRLPSSLLDGISMTSTGSALDIPRQSGILSKEEVEITELYDASGLIEKLKSREFSAVAVTTAFCKRAAIAKQLVCLLEWVNYEITRLPLV